MSFLVCFYVLAQLNDALVVRHVLFDPRFDGPSVEKVIDGKGLLESDLMEASDQQIVGDVAQLGELFHLFGNAGRSPSIPAVEDLFEVGGIIEGGRVRVHGDVGPVLFEDRPELLPVCGGNLLLPEVRTRNMLQKQIGRWGAIRAGPWQAAASGRPFRIAGTVLPYGGKYI